MHLDEGVPGNGNLVVYEESLVEEGRMPGGVGGGEGRGCAIKRGVTGLVRKVSQKVVNNNKGNNNNNNNNEP